MWDSPSMKPRAADDDDLDRLRLAEQKNQFAAEMGAKLLAKHREGQRGWDDPEFIESGRCKQMLLNHVSLLLEGEPQEVDIANFCMFLAHYRHQQELKNRRRQAEGDQSK